MARRFAQPARLHACFLEEILDWIALPVATCAQTLEVQFTAERLAAEDAAAEADALLIGEADHLEAVGRRVAGFVQRAQDF